MRTSILLLLAGFTAWVPARGSAQAAQPVPCTVPIASSPQEPWQQISAQGFTFCVPNSWRATRGNTIRGDGGWVRWGTGERPPGEVRTVTVNVPAGSLPPTPPRRQNRAEMIGGSVAEVWDNEYEGTFYTGAQWQTPVRIYLQGESRNPAARDRQLEIYRTVRFTPQ